MVAPELGDTPEITGDGAGVGVAVELSVPSAITGNTISIPITRITHNQKKKRVRVLTRNLLPDEEDLDFPILRIGFDPLFSGCDISKVSTVRCQVLTWRRDWLS